MAKEKGTGGMVGFVLTLFEEMTETPLTVLEKGTVPLLP